MSDINLPLIVSSQCENGICTYVPIKTKHDKIGIFTSVFTILFSLPALMGSCCWPVLLAGLGSITVTSASRQLSHTISFGINLTMLTNLIQYLIWKKKKVDASIYILIFATFLIMTDLTRHILMDTDMIDLPMYKDDCEPLYGFHCLTPIGWVVTIGFTYSGFILLIISTLWSSNIYNKISLAWNDLRTNN